MDHGKVLFYGTLMMIFKVIKEGLVEGTNIKIRVNDAISGPDGSFYCGTDATKWQNDLVLELIQITQ